jgi:hypothetical protein
MGNKGGLSLARAESDTEPVWNGTVKIAINEPAGTRPTCNGGSR